MPLIQKSCPPVIWIDTAYASFSADTLPKALCMAGDSGLVAVVFSNAPQMTSAFYGLRARYALTSGCISGMDGTDLSFMEGQASRGLYGVAR